MLRHQTGLFKILEEWQLRLDRFVMQSFNSSDTSFKSEIFGYLDNLSKSLNELSEKNFSSLCCIHIIISYVFINLHFIHF